MGWNGNQRPHTLRRAETIKPADSACCAPSRLRAKGTVHAAPPVARRGRRIPDTIRVIMGGRGLLGTDNAVLPDDGESPLRRTRIRPFLMSEAAVTNTEFQTFAQDTGYLTEAERYGWYFVFWSNLAEGARATHAVDGVEWWRRVEGANWRDITGTGSTGETWHADHPAVHISWNDARAYADWVGGRLPTEAEWEHAARGGLGDVRYPWGDTEPDDENFLPCNIWQGAFPARNNCADGYATTAPGRSFKPNGYGLFNMVGNVWEWTADPFRIKSLKKQTRQRLLAMRGFKVLKGGSFLCHRSYCHRYRIAARTGNSPDSTTSHQGFRVVWDQ